MRGQWWIPVIAIVLGTGLAIAINRIPGGHHNNDVKLDLSQHSSSTIEPPTSEDSTTSTILDDTSTTLDLAALAAQAGSTDSSGGGGGGDGGGGSHTTVAHPKSTSGSKSGGTKSGGGGGNGGATDNGGTTATTAPAQSGPNTTKPGDPGSPDWCAKQGADTATGNWCYANYGYPKPKNPPTTTPTHRTTTTEPDAGDG